MRSRTGVLRVAALALAAGGLVSGASFSSASYRLAEPRAQAGLPHTSDVLVDEAGLLCPGQGRAGAQGLRDVAGTVRVAASAPPAELVPGLDPSRGGDLGVTAIPSGASLGSSVDRGRPVTGTQPAGSTTDALLAQADGALAPGLVAAQTWLRQGDDDRGLSLTPCALPASDLWLVAGGAGPSRTERLVLSNSGGNAVSVRLEILGGSGPVAGLENRVVSIGPRSRAVVSIDALAPEEASPVVHVIASGGVVSGVLVDSWIDGATGRGTDDATPSAAPSTELLIAGIDVDGAATLRLANPGAAEALARVVLLTPTGADQPESLRAVRVPARATVDVPLAGLAKGVTGVRILADQPLTAAAWVERRSTNGADRMGDFGWAPATPAIRGLAGTVLPRGGPALTATLELAAGPAGGRADITTVSGGAASTRTLTLVAEGAAAVPLGQAEAVWVVPAAGEVHGAVTVSAADAGGPLYSIAALTSAPVTALSLPVRQLGN